MTIVRILFLLLAPSLAVRGADAPSKESSDRGLSAEELEAFLKTALERKSSDPSVLDGVDPRRADAKTRTLIRALKSTHVDLELEKQPIEAVLELLRSVSGLSFVLSARAAEALKSDKVEVTFAVSGLPLENALNLLMLQLRDYRFAIRYGAIVLRKSEEYKPPRVLKVYDVHDLVSPRPDFTAPPLGLGGKARGE